MNMIIVNLRLGSPIPVEALLGQPLLSRQPLPFLLPNTLEDRTSTQDLVNLAAVEHLPPRRHIYKDHSDHFDEDMRGEKRKVGKVGPV